MNDTVTESIAEDVARRANRARHGIPVVENAMESAMEKLTARSIAGAKAELQRRVDLLTWQIRMLAILVVALATISGLLVILHAYIGATVALVGTMIPSLMLLTRYDRREMLNRKPGGRK